MITKLDRLARNMHFISGLMESKVKFVACDMPEANQLTTHLMASFARYEAQRISERTKDALTATKTRGVILGATGPANLKPPIEAGRSAAQAFAQGLSHTLNGFRADGLTQRQMADELNRLGIHTAKGGQWSLMQLQRAPARLL